MKRKIATWLPVFSGFYGNFYWEPDFEGEAQHFEETYGYKKNDLWEHFEYRKWEAAIAKALCSELEDMLSDFVSKIELEKVSSPKEYNFTNDAIHCIITPKKKEIRKYILEHRTEFNAYIKERYTSCDGFISFYDNDGEDWIQLIDECLVHDHKLGSLLEFICRQEDITEESLYYRLQDRSVLFAGEYFSDEFYREVTGVPEFVRENYMREDLLSLLYQEFDADKFDLEGIMYKTFREIESATLELKFKK